MVVPEVNPVKEKILRLISDREKLEAKIKEFGDILIANENVGMQGSLIDNEGFPRNDIDIYQVRQARHQIICLQNDHKELMKQIEKLMHQLHAQTANEPQLGLSINIEGMQLDDISAGTPNSNDAEIPLTVIAKINFVSPGSPSEEAGIRVNDEIIEFGTINSRNFKNDLNKIGDIVRHMENQRVSMKILREQQILDMILIPKAWSGRGLLGCNIVLPDAIER